MWVPPYYFQGQHMWVPNDYFQGNNVGPIVVFPRAGFVGPTVVFPRAAYVGPLWFFPRLNCYRFSMALSLEITRITLYMYALVYNPPCTNPVQSTLYKPGTVLHSPLFLIETYIKRTHTQKHISKAFNKQWRNIVFINIMDVLNTIQNQNNNELELCTSNYPIYDLR